MLEGGDRSMLEKQVKAVIPPSNMKKRVASAAVILSIFVLWNYLCYGYGYPLVTSARPEQKAFEWSSIKPSRKLQYTPCYHNYECARLEVPLDWNATIDNDLSNPTIALAIARKPAAVDVTDPRYGGVILFNPGGPGASGIHLLLEDGSSLQTIVSSGHSPRNASEDVKFYDILSWDPRGVNHTTPGFICIQDRQARIAWEIQDATLGQELEDPSIFAQRWARSNLLGETCASINGANEHGTSDSLGEFMGTASVVRDMVEIVERHGEWREAIAQKLLLHDNRSLRCRSEALARTAWNVGNEQLQYWGFSYGSLLGQYFATMQPARVGRMVLDGVANADDYAAGEWSQNLYDTDAMLLEFATRCFAAGSLCPIFDHRGEAQIEASVHTTVAALKVDPLTGRDIDNTPFLVSASLLTDTIFEQLYSPFFGFSEIARLLAAAINGNASYFIPYLPVKPCASEALSLTASRHDIVESFIGIACADGLPHLTETKSAFKSYISTLAAESSLFASGWALHRAPCHGYPVRSRWHFPGPFGAVTAHPILFASQALDPVTPLRHAETATKRYPGSGILKAGGMGHCTTTGASMCAMKAVRNYFQTGHLPVMGLVCESEIEYFAEGGPRARFEWAEEGDGELWEAIMCVADKRAGRCRDK